MSDTARTLQGPDGPLAIQLTLPDAPPRAVAVIVPPHPDTGLTFHAHVVYQAAQAFARLGVAALRVELGEMDTAASGVPVDASAVARIAAALRCAAARFPGLPRWAVGVSYGAAVAWTASLQDPGVTVRVGIGTPVGHVDLEALVAVGRPVFLIHGEADTLVHPAEVRAAYARLPEPRELVLIEDADHLFDGKASLVADALVDLLEDWTDV